ncbi:MAG: hypothetical protein PHI97_17750 [Desulfobulbus sp.]|nr:hypothetical protein [Desulfobulbus sp.]
MTTDSQRVYLDQLSKRWQKSPDQLLEIAAKKDLNLWYEFLNVIVHRVKKKKKTEPELAEHIEIQPQTEVIEMMIGRTDRIQVAAQYPCHNSKGKPVLISNAAGEEWGETSMIGLNPMRLYALLEELPQIERKQGITPLGLETASSCCCQSHQEEEVSNDGEFISADHPCFAPELHIALECWLELMGEEDSPDTIQKSDILEWLHDRYPKLSKTAAERIALVVTPAAKQKR